MYKIAICDDDADFILSLKELLIACNNTEQDIVLSEFLTGEELLASKFDDYDVIFLDIQMENMNGNEVAVRLKKRGYQGLLVQCSGIFMPTPETIKISPYRYILKQLSKEEMMKEIGEIYEEMVRRKECNEMEAFYQREKIKVRVADIAYITHHKNGRSVLHLQKERQKKYEDGNIIVSYNFNELMALLGVADFAMPHNSHMVNLRYISSFDMKREFLMVEGTRISVSRSMKDEFFERFTNYSTQKYKRSSR